MVTRVEREAFSADDHRWMAEALRLAEAGLYTTDPNPRVGCVVVADGARIGGGYHLAAGGPHAEVHALREAGERAQGATAYVTLEPCSHHGRTPPCCEALIKAGVSRVVVALEDPNPEVAGQGLERLRAAGITVETGLLREQSERLNPGFLKRMRDGLPYVRLKMAQSLDGRTAMDSGESQWITGAAAREDVQRLRGRSSAIMTGVGTVLADNPGLDLRLEITPPRQPLRVVLDPQAQTPPQARILNLPGAVLMVVGEGATIPQGWSECSGVEWMEFPLQAGRFPFEPLLRALAARGINELHVEAGATLAGALMEQQWVDQLVIYTAPVLLGSTARPLFHLPLERMAQRLRLTITDLRQLGKDLRITAEPVKSRRWS